MFDGRKSRVFLKVLDLLENSAVEISDTLEVSAAHSADSSAGRWDLGKYNTMGLTTDLP